MIVCFFNHKGVIAHYESIAQGQMVNHQCYFEVLTRLRKCVRRKGPGFESDKLILHNDNDNAPAHNVLRVREFLAKNSITKTGHPPYSPDLTPEIFGSFQN
jgi:transposase